MTRPDADAFVPLSPEEIQQAVRQFSHDVINTLQSIHNTSQGLLMEARPDPRLNEDLSRIKKSAEEAWVLVRELSILIVTGRAREDDPTGS